MGETYISKMIIVHKLYKRIRRTFIEIPIIPFILRGEGMNKKLIKGIIIILFCFFSIITIASAEEKNMELQYEVTIDDYSSGIAKVDLSIRNIHSNELIMKNYTGNSSGLKVENFMASTINGIPLDVEIIDGLEGIEWKIDTTPHESIIITYQVNKQVLIDQSYYKGYIGNGFAAVSGYQLFLAPSIVANISDTIKVSFHLPNKEDKVITPWRKGTSNDENLYPNDVYLASDRKARQEDVLYFLLRSPIALGEFVEYSKKVEETNVKVALSENLPNSRTQELLSNFYQLYEYYYHLFGSEHANNYLYIYIPESHDKKYIELEGSNIGQGMRSNDGSLHDDYSYTHTGHGLFHKWNGWVWCWNYNHNDFGFLFLEGINRYYEGKSMTLLNDSSHLKHIYETYIERLANDNLPISTPYKDLIMGNEDHEWMIYDYAALLFMVLDIKIIEDSYGQYSLDTIVKRIDDWSRENVNNEISTTFLINELKDITGKDYTTFFSEYIWGTNKVNVDHYFMDNDLDGVDNYTEYIKGTYSMDNPLNLDGRMFPMKEDVSPNKQWTVTFSMGIDEASLSLDNVFVLNKYGKRVGIQVKKSAVNKIIIKPEVSYESGKEYYLVLKDIKSMEGKKIEFTWMKFIVGI